MHQKPRAIGQVLANIARLPVEREPLRTAATSRLLLLVKGLLSFTLEVVLWPLYHWEGSILEDNLGRIVANVIGLTGGVAIVWLTQYGVWGWIGSIMLTIIYLLAGFIAWVEHDMSHQPWEAAMPP